MQVPIVSTNVKYQNCISTADAKHASKVPQASRISKLNWKKTKKHIAHQSQSCLQSRRENVHDTAPIFLATECL